MKILYPAVAGDVVKFDGARHLVDESCAPDVTPNAFHCITHDQPLANEYQLVSHLETAGLSTAHVVARWCRTHHRAEAL